MAVELGPFVKWFWTIPAAWIGSQEFRLRGKVSEKTCKAVQEGFAKEMSVFKKHVDDKFDDWKEFNAQQTGHIISEIKSIKRNT